MTIEARRKELIEKDRAWSDKQTALWHEFVSTLSPEQKALLTDYQQASTWRQKIRNRLVRLRRAYEHPPGRPPDDIPWPE
jgi:hypothetical protein